MSSGLSLRLDVTLRIKIRFSAVDGPGRDQDLARGSDQRQLFGLATADQPAVEIPQRSAAGTHPAERGEIHTAAHLAIAHARNAGRLVQAAPAVVRLGIQPSV